MQFICGATYYIVARKNKNLTNVTAETTDEKTDTTPSPQTEEIATTNSVVDVTEINTTTTETDTEHP
jgi:hypothetical protein